MAAKAVAIGFATLDLVAAVGMWLLSAWGGVMWLLTVTIELVLTFIAPNIFSVDTTRVAALIASIVLFLILTSLSAGRRTARRCGCARRGSGRRSISPRPSSFPFLAPRKRAATGRAWFFGQMRLAHGLGGVAFHCPLTRRTPRRHRRNNLAGDPVAGGRKQRTARHAPHHPLRQGAGADGLPPWLSPARQTPATAAPVVCASKMARWR